MLRLANNKTLRPTASVLDNASMTMHFDYWEATGEAKRHQVWYDDPKTLAAKYALAAKKGARGVAMWRTSFGDDSMWEALRSSVRASRQ